jgi:asparagine synthase (glutamine-hydrolysing)
MCGICGKINFDFSSPVKAGELRKMTGVIVHRGPDDEGYHLAGHAGLGFRRLSIIDLKTGHQPLSNEDDSIWIVFNGEIYNHYQLRRQLEARGHQFKTRTDTEAIVHLYEEYGKDCVRHLRGMFAFAIWDERKKKLFCARDRFGIKPFFYYLDDKKLVFGSEIKSLLIDPDINRKLSLPALDDYLTYGYTSGEQTIFEHIRKLKPAHTMEWQPGGGVVFSRYWDIRYQPDEAKSEEEWCEMIEEKLSEAVKIRLMSDVPLGAFLSGGIDSSAVVAMMARHSDRPVKTFSIGFKEAAFNELEYAREIARLYATEHHEQIVEPESIELLPKLVKAYDEPFADSSAIPTYYVSKFARQYVTVALSGDGGDELFAGYKTYAKMQKIHDLNFTPDVFNQYFWGGIHHVLPTGMKGKGLTYYLSRPRKTVAAYTSIWQLTERPKLYHPGIWDRIDCFTAEKTREKFISDSPTEDVLFNMQQTDMHNFLVDDILTKVDRASMLNSLEVRVPILDHELAELTFSIPSHLKLNGDRKKYIFKKAMASYLPPSIRDHKKQGFEAPLQLWFKSELKEYINDRLILTKGPLYDYLNPGFVAKTIKDFHNGGRDLNKKIWSLLFFD